MAVFASKHLARLISRKIWVVLETLETFEFPYCISIYHFISCLFTIFRYLRKNPSASRSNRLNQSSELPPRPQQSSSQSGHKKRHSHRKMKMIDINDEIEKCILYGKETTLWNKMWFFFLINYYFCFDLQLIIRHF